MRSVGHQSWLSLPRSNKMDITCITLGFYKEIYLLASNLPFGDALIVHNAKIHAIISGILLRIFRLFHHFYSY